MTSFLISSMVLALVDLLQIFSQLYLIELLGLLTGLGLLELLHLIYPRLLAGFGMLVFFTNLNLMEFQVRYLALFLPFSVIDSFNGFWMESLHRNTTLYSKSDQASDLWQQLELASELESNAGKPQMVLFDWSNTGAIDVKTDGSVLQEK